MPDDSVSVHISWHVELVVKAGEFANFMALTKEMIKTARREHGTIIYERFGNEDDNIIYLYERYANASAALAHLQEFEKTYGEQFAKLVERKRFTVFGTPNDGLRNMLDRYGATYFRILGGFYRNS